jgi:SOS response regulatory protein OraA/RecX
VSSAETEAAVELALRALRHRDRSAAQIDGHLASRGVAEQDRADALATLVRTGLVDDRRFAETRVTTLAGRGAGDAFIRHDLAHAGIDGALVDDALTAVDGELVRAERVVARRGGGPKTARYLTGKGFSPDVVNAVIAELGDDGLG